MACYLKTKNKLDCNGCSTCALVCPKKCIRMVEDNEGFLYPQVDDTECIKCNKCIRFCSNFNIKTETNEKAYIAINNSKKQLVNSSSGGMFLILAEYVINQSGVVFGVTYNDKLEAVHEYAETLEDCNKFCGSKYVRSNLQDSYMLVKEFLKNDRYVLFTGTACEINGLKKFLNKDYEKLILSDILCHANPSPKVFKLYIENLEYKNGKKIIDIKFRSKKNGWRNKKTIITYEDGSEEGESSYSKAFASELINRPSCYNCQFASQRRISDFTIGDFWGIEKVDSKIDESNGVSLLTINSSKGKQIFEKIKDKMNVKEVDYDLACSYNHYCNVKPNKNRDKFFKKLEDQKINSTNIIEYMIKFSKKSLLRRVLSKCKKMSQKFLRS